MGHDLLRRLIGKLRKLRALRQERATKPRTIATYLRPDPTGADAMLAAELCAVMRREGVAEPPELVLLMEGRHLANSELDRLVSTLDALDDSLFAAERFETP